MPTITEVLQRQSGAIQGMDRANANAQARLSDSNSSSQQLYNAKNDVRIASQEGGNARYEATVYKNQNPSEYDQQITTNNELIQQRREQSFESIQQIDQRIGPDYTPVRTDIGGDTAVTGTDEDIAPDFTPVRGETQGATSSGAIVDNEALARADGAGTQTPYPSHLSSSTVQGQSVTQSNADRIPTSPYGTFADAPVTPDILIGQPVSSDDAQDIQDDTFVTSATGGVKTAKAFYEPFTPSDNPTNKYAQLTYNIGLYLQTPEQYKQLIVSQNKTTQGLKKILQSGGNAATDDVIFPDLYIDDLEIQGLFAEANSSPHNVTRMNFKIVEPMGYTFFQKLKKLCADSGMTEFSKQHYLMVIKYKGFDENGKQVSEADDDRLSKFIPFVFSKITTKVATGAIDYNCEAVALNHEVALSAKRATIPFNVELLGQTLSDLFNATAEVTEKPAESTSQTNATSPFGTTETTVTPGILKSQGGTPQQNKGIVDALNKQQKKLATKLGYKYADKYKVTFKGDIGKQKIISSDALLTVKKSKPMSASVKAAASSILNQTSLDKSRQIYSIPAGTGIHQVLDIMIRSSEYITKQQTHVIDPKTGEVKPNPSQNKFLQWYHIGVRVLPIAWDDKRGDYAYEIEYIISPKQIIDTYSPYFPKAKLRGVHKSYNYWFTGENTEILNYEQDLNTTFFVAMDGRIPQTEQKTTEDSQRITTKAHVNMSGSTGLGQPGDNASPAEQAANVIYSTVDFAMFNMDIIGDPDYVQQNDILYTSGDTFDAFMPDGSINYDSQEVLVEVKFKTMEDYNAVTGGADLKDPLFTDGVKTSKGLIYKLTHVTSSFKKGVMTQNIRGILREFDEEESEVTADTAREEQPFVGPTRGSMNMPGYNAVTYGANNYAPDFTPISVKGNKVPGDAAITSGSDIAPNFTPISTAQNGQGQYDTAGPIGPDFTPRDNGNSVPGQRAVSDNPTAPDFLPVRGETQGN